MKRFVLTSSRASLALLLSCLVACVQAGTCIAQPQAAPSLEVSLPESSVMLGEPIVVRYTVSNPTGQSARLEMGLGEEGWYTVQLTDAAGRPLPDSANQPPPYLSASGPAGRTLAPGRSCSGTIVASQWVRFAAPGSYRLIVKAQLPYTLSPPSDAVGDAGVYRAALTQSYSLPIEVTPADHTKLRGAAETLKTELFRGGADEVSQGNLRKLFSMPEADALPQWQAVTGTPGLPVTTRSEIPRQLFCKHSPAASDLLIGMAQDQAQGLVVQNLAWLYLDRLYRTSDAFLRQHIAEAMSARGMKLPSAPLISID